MQVTLIPCEVYGTRSDAIQALATDLGRPAAERPSTEVPLLVMEDVRGVTCLAYDSQTWRDNAEALQPLLRSLSRTWGAIASFWTSLGSPSSGRRPYRASILSGWR